MRDLRQLAALLLRDIAGRLHPPPQPVIEDTPMTPQKVSASIHQHEETNPAHDPQT